MPLDTNVIRSSGDIVLDWDPAHPPERGTGAPPLSGPCLLWPNGWMDQDVTCYRGRPRPRRHCIRWGPSSLHGRGHSSPPTFRPMIRRGGWWMWTLASPDGVAPSRVVCVSASVNLPLHHKIQKFSSGTGSPGWSWKKGPKTVVVWCRSGLLWPNSWIDYIGRPWPRWHSVRWGPSSPNGEGHSTAGPSILFSPCLLCPNGHSSQQLLSSCYHLTRGCLYFITCIVYWKHCPDHLRSHCLFHEHE